MRKTPKRHLNPWPSFIFYPFTFILVLGSCFLVSCEPSVEESIYEEKLVVFGNLIADLPVIDTVFVSLSYQIEEPHEQETKWIADADVVLSDGKSSFPLSPVPGKPGRYLDLTFSHIVQPGTTYRLNVTWEDHEVGAATAVPDAFSLASISSSEWKCGGESVVVPAIDLREGENSPEKIEHALMTKDFTILAMDTVIYREGDCWSTSFASIPLFILRWESDYEPGLIRIISLALDDTATNAIVDTSLSGTAFKGPMYRDTDGNYYRPNPFVWNAKQQEQHINWIYFNYYGPHLMTVVATDQSAHDYFQGDPFRINQYVLPNGNIEGGYGLFSSAYARSFFVYVAPDEP
ncbi:MAG: DUF4249 family protein [Candidatus Neomarinimicrobiota bacterium]